MKRPLMFIALFFISGILAAFYITDNISIVLFFVAVLLASAGMFAAYRWKPLLLFIIFAAAGFFNVYARGLPENNIFAQTAGISEVTFNAAVTGMTKTAVFAETIPEGVKILVYPGTAEVYGIQTTEIITYPGGEAAPGEPAQIKAGDIITITGMAQNLSSQRNPGGFDEKMYYAARGIKYKIYPDTVHVSGGANTFSAKTARFREKLAQIYDNCLPETEAGIMKSIILGDRQNLEDDVKNLYSAAGIYHILAISGLHISIIALFLNFLLCRFFTKRASSCCVLCFLVFFCLFTGAAPSTVRAVIISGVLIFANLIFRKTDGITSLSFAALCILCYNPFFLWDLGFQLSFAAMAGIILLSSPVDILLKYIAVKIPALKKFLENYFVNTSISVSSAAFIATLPVGSGFLTHISTYTVLVNIILFPTFFLLVTVGFITGLVGLVSYNAAYFLSGSLYYLLNFYEIILEFFVSLPFSRILTGHIPVYLAAAYYSFVAAIAYLLLKYPDTGKIKKYAALTFAAFAVCVCIKEVASRNFTLTMLDVGQGDCFVIRNNGKTCVIDGGGRVNYSADSVQSVSIGDNTGARVLVPYLNYLGAQDVDAAVITHLEGDHAAGIIELLQLKKVKTLYLPEGAKMSELYIETEKAAKEYNTEIVFLQSGDTLQVGGATAYGKAEPGGATAYGKTDPSGITMYCLNPTETTKNLSANDASLVLKLVSGNLSVLFTGDISEAAESRLLEDENLQSDILKVAHHGSKYSSSEEFLNKVSARLAIVSYSKYNSYGFVSSEVKTRLSERKIPLFSTAENGAVIITKSANGVKIYSVCG
ncbi:MAG: DNA internalization-related competence protein ComEC/Rec2 [Clostridiales bacterium]|jgi:competence protein ComEC|nr:DNA internalization-related competence protein ComEC/Rec2 [Clostridiales bacterium]